jgi:hypothetical protein
MIKHLTTSLPHASVPVLLLTLVVEAINLSRHAKVDLISCSSRRRVWVPVKERGVEERAVRDGETETNLSDLSRFMVPSQQGDVRRVLGFESEEKGERF